MTSPTQAPPSLGLAALALARAHLGVHEEPPGSNTGPDVRRYLAPCVRGGRRLWQPDHVPPEPWCAAFASWCVWTAAHARLRDDLRDIPELALAWDAHEWIEGMSDAPIGYRAAVSELRDDARATGALRLPQAAEEPLPGDLLVWEHHVGICSEWGASKLAICGNDGDRVAEVTLGPNGEHPRAGALLAWIKL
jgi:hypothetical protein